MNNARVILHRNSIIWIELHYNQKNSHFSFSHHTSGASASWRNEMKLLHIVKLQRNNAS